VTDRPALYRLDTPPDAVGWRDPATPKPMLGHNSAWRAAACARAASILSAAIRRSRLLAKASRISACKRGSVNACSQGTSAATTPLLVPASGAETEATLKLVLGLLLVAGKAAAKPASGWTSRTVGTLHAAKIKGSARAASPVRHLAVDARLR
jgi:hypothetical protein